MINTGYVTGRPRSSCVWLKDTKGALYLVCEEDNKNTDFFYLIVPSLNFELKIIRSNLTDGIQVVIFITSLDRQHKVVVLVGGLSLPFNNEAATLIRMFA